MTCHLPTSRSAQSGPPQSARVSDWMTPHPHTCSPLDSLADAWEVMMQHNIRRLPVVDAEGQLVGIISYGDLREAAPSSIAGLSLFEVSYFWARLLVRDAMTPHPITIEPDASIQEAAQIMLAHKIGGLPVVTNGHLIGIFTESDILRFVVAGF